MADPEIPPPAREPALLERLLSVIDRGAGVSLGEAEFDSLALEVFAHQFDGNSVYRSYCSSRGAVPGRVEHWIDLPAVPTDAFRVASLVCGDPSTAEAVFRTSGTSGGATRRGTHYLQSTHLYKASLRAGFTRALLPDRARIAIFSLVPTRHQLPDSSLSFMVDDAVAEYGTDRSGFYVSEGGLNLPDLLDALTQVAGDDVTVLLAGTSFAFVHLLDGMEEKGAEVRLPAGSRVMDTGGFKGRSREVSRGDLYTLMSERLGVGPRWIVNEYGMTEMSSQFYDGIAGEADPHPGSRLHRGPGWVRSVAVDPETLRPVPTGETGILRHVDLANLDSVIAIQTYDLGRVYEGGIEVLGRVPGATARGCSIAMDDLLRAT
jgi:hypothetical protein